MDHDPQKQARILTEIQALKELRRTIIELKSQGNSEAQIAEMLNISVSRVEGLLLVADPRKLTTRSRRDDSPSPDRPGGPVVILVVLLVNHLHP